MKIRLLQARQRRLLSQRELAERSGLAQTTISAIELGKQTPHLSTIRRLAEALRVDPDELIEAEDPA